MHVSEEQAALIGKYAEGETPPAEEKEATEEFPFVVSINTFGSKKQFEILPAIRELCY